MVVKGDWVATSPLVQYKHERDKEYRKIVPVDYQGHEYLTTIGERVFFKEIGGKKQMENIIPRNLTNYH